MYLYKLPQTLIPVFLVVFLLAQQGRSTSDAVDSPKSKEGTCGGYYARKAIIYCTNPLQNGCKAWDRMYKGIFCTKTGLREVKKVLNKEQLKKQEEFQVGIIKNKIKSQNEEYTALQKQIIDLKKQKEHIKEALKMKYEQEWVDIREKWLEKRKKQLQTNKVNIKATYMQELSNRKAQHLKEIELTTKNWKRENSRSFQNLEILNSKYREKEDQIKAKRDKQVSEVERIYKADIDNIEKDFEQKKKKSYEILLNLIPRMQKAEFMEEQVNDTLKALENFQKDTKASKETAAKLENSYKVYGVKLNEYFSEQKENSLNSQKKAQDLIKQITACQESTHKKLKADLEAIYSDWKGQIQKQEDKLMAIKKRDSYAKISPPKTLMLNPVDKEKEVMDLHESYQWQKANLGLVNHKFIGESKSSISSDIGNEKSESKNSEGFMASLMSFFSAWFSTGKRSESDRRINRPEEFIDDQNENIKGGFDWIFHRDYMLDLQSLSYDFSLKQLERVGKFYSDANKCYSKTKNEADSVKNCYASMESKNVSIVQLVDSSKARQATKQEIWWEKKEREIKSNGKSLGGQNIDLWKKNVKAELNHRLEAYWDKYSAILKDEFLSKRMDYFCAIRLTFHQPKSTQELQKQIMEKDEKKTEIQLASLKQIKIDFYEFCESDPDCKNDKSFEEYKAKIDEIEKRKMKEVEDKDKKHLIDNWEATWQQNQHKEKVDQIRKLGSKKNLDTIKERYQKLLKSLNDRREKEASKLQRQIDIETSGSKKIQEERLKNLKKTFLHEIKRIKQKFNQQLKQLNSSIEEVPQPPNELREKLKLEKKTETKEQDKQLGDRISILTNKSEKIYKSLKYNAQMSTQIVKDIETKFRNHDPTKPIVYNETFCEDQKRAYNKDMSMYSCLPVLNDAKKVCIKRRASEDKKTAVCEEETEISSTEYCDKPGPKQPNKLVRVCLRKKRVRPIGKCMEHGELEGGKKFCKKVNILKPLIFCQTFQYTQGIRTCSSFVVKYGKEQINITCVSTTTIFAHVRIGHLGNIISRLPNLNKNQMTTMSKSRCLKYKISQQAVFKKYETVDFDSENN